MKYKAELIGIINVIKVNEDHTSKCSFLDYEPVKQKNKERIVQSF